MKNRNIDISLVYTGIVGIVIGYYFEKNQNTKDSGEKRKESDRS